MKSHLLTARPAWFDAVVLIRVVIGYMFFKHGLQIFDEEAMKGYVDWSGDLGFKPGVLWAYAGKIIELVGGLFLILGLFTRIVSIPMAVSMAIITFMFHKGQPFNGDEYPFMLMLFALLFFFTGPGRWSVDQLLFEGGNLKRLRNIKKTSVLLILPLMVHGCGQINSTGDIQSIKTKDTLPLAADKTPKSIVTPTKLDSIDQANNESVIASGDDITKAVVFLKNGDSTIHVTANIRKDHRIIGYAEPDITSERLLLLSVFTNDVEKNPFGCKLGAYYDTGGMKDWRLKYNATTGNFVKAEAIDKANKSTTIYFERQWITLE